MPKVIVLFFGAESPEATWAEAAAAGATGVRFTEVELLSGALQPPRTAHRHKPLESPEQLRHFDGVILACPAEGAIRPDLSALLDALERSASGVFTNTVFGIIGAEHTALATRVIRLGGILVGDPPGTADPESRAMRLGARVATVVSWVRHALSHEHGHRDQEVHGAHEHHGAS